MTPILYESDEKEFWSKGLGPLSDAEKCTVTEERNGAYTLSMTYPIDGAQADKIANNRIIKADNAYDLKNQLFVIKTVTPIMTETGEISLSVYAEHISYITNDLSIPPELSLTGTAQQALDQWKDSLIGGDTSGITVDSDVTNTSSTLLTIQNVANARQALGGVEGSILYCWKGEYRFDNLHISLKKQRGTTANTLLSYGRNLLTFEQEQNIAETYTTLYPYALVTTAGGMIQKLVTIDGYLVDSKYVSHYPNRKIKTHDFSSDFQNYRIGAKPSENAEEGVTYTDLATIKKYLKGKALHFMTTNDIGVPKISTTITFADLSKTDDELAKFEKLSLCDKVPVRFEKLGINSTIKVTRTVWNVLADSYDSIELGDLTMTIGETVASVSAETSAIKTKVNQASVTAQIAADGTHNIFRTDGETEPIAKKVGDLWYKTDGKYTSMYQWDGKAWVLIVNTRDTADVRAELDQAKSDMAQAKTDAQTAHDEAVKATGTANGAKAQTDEALKQAKQANDSYTTLAKEVAGNKASVDADYKRVSDSYTALSKEVADNKASVDADYQKAQADIAQAKTDAQNAYNEAVKATSAANGAKAETTKALEQAKQANSSYTALAKEVADNKTSVDTDVADIRKAIDANKASADADYKKAQTDIAQAQKDLSSVTDTVTEVKKGQGELSAKVAGKVDNTVYQTYVKQTNQSLSEKLVASDLSGYAKTVDVTKSIDGVKTTIADNKGKISTMQTDIDGVKTSVANAQGDIATIKTDVSGTKQTVANAQKDITSIKTSVSGVQTDITNAKKDITSVKTDISGVKTSVSNVQGDVTSLKTSVGGVQADVKNAKGDITSIKTDVSGVKTTIADHTGKITSISKTVDGLTTSVSNKVDNTVYQSYVAQTDKELSTKLTESDLRGYAKTVDVKQTTDGLSASITKVQGDLNGLQIGGANLLDGSSMENTKFGDHWYSSMTYKDGWTLFTSSSANQNRRTLYYVFPVGQPDPGTYTVSLDVKLISCTSELPKARVMIRERANWHRYADSGELPLKVGEAVRMSATGSVPSSTGEMRISIEFATSNWFVGQIAIRHVKLEKGTKATDWCMSDNDVQSQLNALSGKITATSDRLSSVYTKSEVDGKLGTKVEQSALTQTSNNLSASIAKNSKILSSAGLVNENAYINANRIALNGKTLMTNATINDAFIGSLSANKITTGTLNAAKVNLINVNASNISTGVLNGIKITSTGKDPSGTSSTTTIQSGYIDTNVINCSDYILVGKADADPRKRWQTKQDSFGTWFTCPAKLNGHTGNAPSDWQTEMQGFIGSDGWNYKNVTVSGTGFSGIKLVLTPEQEWGRPYGGDQWSIGNWIRTEASGKSGDIRDGALDPVMWYSYTGQGAAYADQLVIQKKTQFFDKANFQGGVRIGVTGANHGIRTAWVSWSDWGSNQKIPCIVQDKDNWGGIAFPANGRTVLFTHERRVTVADLPAHGGSYNGWGS